MYTGITQGLFTVVKVEKQLGLVTYDVELNQSLIKDLEVGASVAVDGVCQTAVKIEGNIVTFNAIEETCNKTTLGNLKVGQKVSIERSAKAGNEVGGHNMFGHIFGTGKIVEKVRRDNNLMLRITCSPDMMQYIFEKGFIGMNGSSLTVNEVDLTTNTFCVHLIPHTLEVTDFANKNIGDEINLELDANTITIVETIKKMPLQEILSRSMQPQNAHKKDPTFFAKAKL